MAGRHSFWNNRLPVLHCADACPVCRPAPHQKHMSDWKPEMRLPSASDYVMLNGLDWNTDYEILVVAENQRGRSEPSITSFRTASEPTTVPGTTSIITPQTSTHNTISGSHRDQRASGFKVSDLHSWSDMNNLGSSTQFIGILFGRPKWSSS